MEKAHTTAVDADFIVHVSTIERPPKQVAEILDKILAGLGLRAVVHPLIYRNELVVQTDTISTLFSEYVIRCLSFTQDIFQADTGREAYYCFLVRELYRRLTGADLPGGVDVVTYWKHKSSLGEIHSVAMCLICGFGLFLSDDGDSKALKQIVEQQTLGRIDVYNRREVLEQCSDACGLTRKDRRAFAHQARS